VLNQGVAGVHPVQKINPFDLHYPARVVFLSACKDSWDVVFELVVAVV
jgi:hypothetical protein